MKDFTFDTIEYSRPDIGAVEEVIKALTAELKNAKSYAEVKDIILRADKATEKTENHVYCGSRSQHSEYHR